MQERHEPTSAFGSWIAVDGLPVFEYRADQRSLADAEWDPVVGPPTRRHWVMLGNARIKLWACNDGRLGLFDESEGLRWVSYPDPVPSGVSVITVADGESWGTTLDAWPGNDAPVRRFGPRWFEISCASGGVRLERVVLCPEGELPWVLVRVRLTETAGRERAVRHREQWAVQPRFVNVGGDSDTRLADAQAHSHFEVMSGARGLRARERRSGGVPARPWRYEKGASLAPTGETDFPQVFGGPLVVVLEALGETNGAPVLEERDPHPTLVVESTLALAARQTVELWFRFGLDEGEPPDDPEALWRRSREQLGARLPKVRIRRHDSVASELTWHAAMLSGGAATDRVIGGHTLDQGSVYSYSFGFNGAARDPLQHALPLVYFDPQLALSVLRNTCAWATPGGDLAYALDGAKRPWRTFLQPSDQCLWALWLASEYTVVTGDAAAFAEPLAYHPEIAEEAPTLGEHLRRQLRFFVNDVGRGNLGHVRIRNADWSDEAVASSGVPREEMIARGESVLNSAMAAWVLPVFAALLRRLDEHVLAGEAVALADDLRERVAAAWNGRWFDRAYTPDGIPIGRDDCWLEVQPWALLCGAAGDDEADALLDTIDAGPRAASPLGARVRWPVPTGELPIGVRGENVAGGGIWSAINAPLVWAAARRRPALAWDEWHRMTLANHTATYPTVWEGVLSGPDCYNAPESERPGRTWSLPELNLAMQSFPVNNLHSHAQPLHAFIRLLGIEPGVDGALRVGSGAAFESATFSVSEDGHGSALAKGPVMYQTVHGRVSGGPGRIEW
jgi:hypothetical protein